MRRNSLTSSHTHSAFDAAFIDYKDDEAWVAIAKYLHGKDYKNFYKIGIEDEEIDDDDASTLDPEQTLLEFVENYIHAEDDQAGEAAFNFLRPYVIENSAEPTQEAADEAISQVTQITLAAFVNILSNCAPASKRKKISSAKALQKEATKWLQFSNLCREFMFLTSNALKDLVAAKRVKIVGSKTIDKMIEALGKLSDAANENNNEEVEQLTHLSPSEKAIRMMIEKGFLPHQKGHGAHS